MRSSRSTTYGSNPFPFLLWIATVVKKREDIVNNHGSNPFPFLLWIATQFVFSTSNSDIL